MLKKIFFPTFYTFRYPWSENPDESESLMKTRAPAWCDRVLMNAQAIEMVKRDKFAKYDSFGKDVCMGDHKVRFIYHLGYLKFSFFDVLFS